VELEVLIGTVGVHSHRVVLSAMSTLAIGDPSRSPLHMVTLDMERDDRSSLDRRLDVLEHLV